ncbi:MAG TPA: SDR family NAD(P)-dependent oxidoreductase [Clostridia bacterium]|nr:SDR family NAD(P)-dependent oxidoreductase [Clostridia bacterium]
MINGKKIVITGANSGIGYETLKILALCKDNLILAVDKNISNIECFSPQVFPFQMDISSKEGVDTIFEEALKVLGGIDIFYANAGYPYYELFNYTDWDRVKSMFETNVFSPIYTYSKFREYLNGAFGIYAVTVSAIGQMAMPGYAIYSASKFAIEGFQQALRLEMDKNIQLTCLYPVATDTNFFKVANPMEFEKPFPVQRAELVAEKMVKGIEKGKKSVYPSKLLFFGKLLMKFFPLIRSIYWALEKKKLLRFKQKLTKNAE